MPEMRCTVTFRDGPCRVIEAEVHATTLFQAVALALEVSRADRQHPVTPDTEFAITSPTGEERLVRYASLAQYLAAGPPSAADLRARLRSLLATQAA